jgi:hypothetical protein
MVSFDFDMRHHSMKNTTSSTVRIVLCWWELKKTWVRILTLHVEIRAVYLQNTKLHPSVASLKAPSLSSLSLRTYHFFTLGLLFFLEYGGSRFLRDICDFLSNFTRTHPRRQLSLRSSRVYQCTRTLGESGSRLNFLGGEAGPSHDIFVRKQKEENTCSEYDSNLQLPCSHYPQIVYIKCFVSFCYKQRL